jgi:hypothetical protein
MASVVGVFEREAIPLPAKERETGPRQPGREYDSVRSSPTPMRRVVKSMIAGATSFWLPDTLHIVRGSKIGRPDVIALSLLMPLMLLGCYALTRRASEGLGERGGWPLMLGVWVLGGIFMAVGWSFSGGGFANLHGARDVVVGIVFYSLPPAIFIMSAYDGSLFALLIVSFAALLMKAPPVDVSALGRWLQPRSK